MAADLKWWLLLMLTCSCLFMFMGNQYWQPIFQGAGLPTRFKLAVQMPEGCCMAIACWITGFHSVCRVQPKALQMPTSVRLCPSILRSFSAMPVVACQWFWKMFTFCMSREIFKCIYGIKSEALLFTPGHWPCTADGQADHRAQAASTGCLLQAAAHHR